MIRKLSAILLLTSLFFALPTWGSGEEKNAFQWSASVKKLPNGRFKAEAVCRIAEKSYLNAGATKVMLKFADGTTTEIKAPPAVAQKDGEAIYAAGVCRWGMFTDKTPAGITADYQGCVGEMCLMPETKILWQASENDPSLAAVTPSVSSKNPSLGPSLAAKVTDKLDSALAKFDFRGKYSGVPANAEALTAFLTAGSASLRKTAADSSQTPAMGFWAILVLVVLGGLGLNLTPCVLPMIPVNLAIIGADAGAAGKLRGFRRGAAYGLGITLAYGVLGLLAALTGSRFGELNSSSIFNFVIAGVFLLLALGMFGVYELDLARIANLFPRKNDGKKRDFPPEITAFALGIASALLAGACVAPVVITVILLAARFYSEGNIWGLALPFALGLSMALPWPLLGAGLSFLPRPGMWMTRVKQIFGAIILVMALYYGYLGWTLRSGAFDQQKAIAALAETLEKSAANKETVLIDCWASWCKNCHALDELLASGAGKQALAQAEVKLIRFQAEKLNDPQVKAFMDKFQLPGLPSMILLQSK